jgi:hypothetical protein
MFGLLISLAKDGQTLKTIPHAISPMMRPTSKVAKPWAPVCMLTTRMQMTQETCTVKIRPYLSGNQKLTTLPMTLPP